MSIEVIQSKAGVPVSFSLSSAGKAANLLGPTGQTYSPPNQILATGTAAATPADTSENIVGTCTVPGGSIGKNGTLRVTASITNGALSGTVTTAIKLGGTTIFATVYAATNTGVTYQTILFNKNSESANFYMNSTAQTNTPTVAGFVDTTIDTSIDQTLQVTITKSVGADAVSLKYLQVQVQYGA